MVVRLQGKRNFVSVRRLSCIHCHHRYNRSVTNNRSTSPAQIDKNPTDRRPDRLLPQTFPAEPPRREKR